MGTLSSATDTADSSTGFHVDSSGNVLIKQGGANAEYLKFAGGGLDIKAGTFDLATSTMILDSGTNSGKIALGSTPPTAYNSGNGFYVDGTGSERIVEAYIQDGSTNNLARSSDQVSNTTGTADYGGCSTSVVKLVNSGDQFIFTIYCLDNGATIHQKTRINFVLLKAIA